MMRRETKGVDELKSKGGYLLSREHTEKRRLSCCIQMEAGVVNTLCTREENANVQF